MSVPLTGVQGDVDHELCVLWRMWFCWRPLVQAGRCTTDTSVSTWNFKEYQNSSVIIWSHHPFRAIHQRKITCLFGC